MTRRCGTATAGGPGVFACACASARLAARAVTQLYDACLAGSGVEATQFALLMTLESAAARHQAALGRRFALDKTTMSRNLAILERRKWIRCTASSDRRERCYELTAEGRRRLAAARAGWRRAQSRLRASMSDADWTAMFSVFGTVIAAAHRAAAR